MKNGIVLLSLLLLCIAIAFSPVSERDLTECLPVDEIGEIVSFVSRRAGVQSSPPPILVVDETAFYFRRCWQRWWWRGRCSPLGMYLGGRRIEITSALLTDVPKLKSVVVHELSHWADHMLGHSLGNLSAGGEPDQARVLTEIRASEMEEAWRRRLTPL